MNHSLHFNHNLPKNNFPNLKYTTMAKNDVKILEYQETQKEQDTKLLDKVENVYRKDYFTDLLTSHLAVKIL